MEKLICIVALLFIFQFVTHADRLPITPDDGKQIGVVNDLLWKESELTKDEESKLLETVKYPHDDVASYAFAAAVARNTKNLSEILKYAMEQKEGNLPEIARHIFIIKEKGDIITTLENELEGVPLIAYKVPYPEEYYRDIIVYSTLLEARKKKEVPVTPKRIEFTMQQKALLEYAFKPKMEIFDYVYSLLQKEQKKSSTIYYMRLALSAYSKVFFDEAIKEIDSDTTSPITKRALIDYLKFNLYRLNDAQQKKVDELINKKV